MNHEMIIEALEALVEKKNNEIYELRAAIDSFSSNEMFLLHTIVELGQARQFTAVIKSKKAGSYKISDALLKDWSDFVCFNGGLEEYEC